MHPRSTAILAAIGFIGLVWSLAPSGGTPESPLFADGFEAQLPACVTGNLSGDTLPLPPLGSAELLGCFEVRNDDVARMGEAVRGSLPIPRSLALDDAALARLVVVGPGARRWPAQFAVLSRWGRPLADSTAPVRWLQTTLAVDIGANSAATLALMRLPAAVPGSDSGALSVSGSGDQRIVDTGLAEFTLDATRAQPLVRLRLREQAGGALFEVFSSQAGSADEGWNVRVLDAAGVPILISNEAIPGSLVIDRARWEALGPVSAELHLDGHLEAPGNIDRCEGIAEWLRFPFSMTLRATRGSRALDLQWQLGNACGAPQATPDQHLAQFEVAEFRLPLARNVEAGTVALAGIGAALQAAVAGASAPIRVQQRRGSGMPWRRRAELSNNGIVLANAEYYLAPAIGLHRALGSARMVAVAQQPWMRYREPQGLEVADGRISFRLVHEPIRVGKAKSLWFAGRIAMATVADENAALSTGNLLRGQNRAALEAGLTLRALPSDLDAAQILPPVSGTLEQAPGLAYRQFLERKQDDTVGDEPCPGSGGDDASQWVCAKTFGLQLWPDIQFNLQFGYEENPDPATNEGKLNYWDPAHLELVEFLRSGDPRWVWAFALPQSRLMSHTAYYNFGDRRGSNIAGHSFGSGGNGDGLWHRSDSGSADYSYNRHQGLAYVLRPEAAARDRMAAAGHAAGLRFVNDPGDNTTWAAIGRLNLQYLESLANCAQFVPGNDGVDCDLRLRQVLGHLIQNSLSSGLMCELMLDAGSSCFLGQFFMLQAWYYPLLERWYLNWGHTFPAAQEQAWRRALAETPVRALEHLPRVAGAVDVNALWPNALLCTLGGAGFTQVQSCNVLPDPDNLTQNKPAFLSLLVRGHAYDGSRGLCVATRQIGSALYASGDPLGPLRAVARGGWWKGAAESAGELVTATLGYERCP